MARTAQPDTADGLIARSIQHLNQHEASQAEIAARRALSIDPLHPKALSALGFALHAQAKYRESEQAYLKMTDVEPAEPMHWMNVGTARRCDDRIDEALYAFAKAAALGADTADFYYNVALAHIGRDDYQAAHSLLEKALKLNPNDAEIRYRYAFCCYETLRTDEALAALDGWEGLPATAPELSANAGHLMMKLGEIDRAEPTVRAAAQQGDADPQARLTLIQLLERTNRTTEARGLLDRLHADPAAALLGNEIKVTEAQLAQRESKHDVAIALFKDIVAACKEAHLRHFQLYPLARSLDALGRYDEAFAVLTEAHASQFAQIKLSAPLAVLHGLPSLSIADHPCDPQDVERWNDLNAPAAEASPIFIVGFPRSGTTLLELVLDAHPLLKSIDEQPFLQNALDDILAEHVRYPAELANLTPEQLDRIRSAYWARTARRLKLAPHMRLIDKNPLNILRLPVIKRLFPNAKVLLVIRHPCDVILSCFMQHFRAPDFALLCTDIPTLAKSYRKTFDFWHSQQALLRAEVFELRYEAFVEDFTAYTRRVFDFLQVPWDEVVLSPARRAKEKRFISTPSYAQVVQPVSAKAVGRWSNYRAHFAAGLPILAPYLERWDYRT
jgi:tetratricopeptide (TPR) repeat protein